ncbi:MAG: L,D-transpeptidase [Firmicutes bacterium]|nr:L,D-transpeptidase [Bacillota bacterium]
MDGHYLKHYFLKHYLKEDGYIVWLCFTLRRFRFGAAVMAATMVLLVLFLNGLGALGVPGASMAEAQDDFKVSQESQEGQKSAAPQRDAMLPQKFENMPGLKIIINIPGYRLYLYKDNVLIREYPIAVGKAVSPTFLGECTVVRKVKNPAWYPPDGRKPVPPGPDNPIGSRWLGLSYDGYGIHGNNDPSSIGKAVSLGCIRMYEEDVQELYDLAPVGTPVKFIYKTILASVDPILARVTITVYPDIYRKGTNTIEAAYEELSLLPFMSRPVSQAGEQVVIGEGTGKPMGEGTRIEEEAQIGGEVRTERTERGVGMQAFRMKMNVNEFILDKVIKEAAGKPVAVPWGVSVIVNGEETGEVGFVDGNGVDSAMLPLEVARVLGAQARWDRASRQAQIDGTPVFQVRDVSGKPFVAAAALASAVGARLRLSVDRVGGGTASFTTPGLVLDGEELRGRVFADVDKGRFQVPLKPITDKLGLTLQWNASKGIAWVGALGITAEERSGRIYVDIRDIPFILPDIEAKWNPDAWVVELTTTRDDRASSPSHPD